jgi:hypothetical protein
MILYIWKIIDLPNIPISELVYKISFDLLLFSPKEASNFVDNAIQEGYLTSSANNKIRLSDELALQLENWHKKRREEISKKINTSKKIIQSMDKTKKSDSKRFNVLLKAFLDAGTINRAVLVSDSAINLFEDDPRSDSIRAEIKGSQKDPYLIEISPISRELKHDCHDFKTKRAQNKKFCKHLAKLFLMLKEKDEERATILLEKITKEINKWEFIT